MSATIAFLPVLAEKMQTEHSWLPETREIVWGGIAFLVVATMLWKLAIPQLAKGLKARSERIGKELDSAAGLRTSAEAAAAQASAAVRDAAADGAKVLADADAAAAKLLAEGRSRFAAEEAELQYKADSDVTAALGRASSEVESRLAQLAIDAAVRIVEESLDDATQGALVESYIANVGSTR